LLSAEKAKAHITFIINKRLFMKTLLLVTFCLSIIISNAQNLNGKLVYSYHSKRPSTKPDSIFSFSVTGEKKFVTLGFDPRVSPFGKYMAFSNGPNPNNVYGANLWIRNLSTHKDKQIITQGDYLNYYDFRPSNKQIVYAQECYIYSSNVDGTNAFTFLNCTPCDCFSDDPQIRSSDGLILYHNLHYGIFTSNADGSNPQQVKNTVPGDLYPVWSYNGKWIAYIKGSFQNIYKIKSNGLDPVKLTFFSSGDTIVPNPVWSKDSKYIYLIGRVKGKAGIYKVNTNGSGNYKRIYSLNSTGGIYSYFLGSSNLISDSFAIAKIAEDDSINADNSIAEVENNPEINVFPNPSNGAFRLVTKEVNKKMEVMITDASGRMVYQNNFYNTSSASIQLQTIKGIYLISVKTNTGSARQKLVIQ